jgi:DNA-binding transcriptional LysR family regulator
VVRTERLLWVTSAKHSVHRADVLPVAFSQYGCAWRQMAIEALEGMGREYRVAYASANSSAISAAVQAGLAVAAIPEICMRPGMRCWARQTAFRRWACSTLASSGQRSPTRRWIHSQPTSPTPVLPAVSRPQGFAMGVHRIAHGFTPPFKAE